MKPSFRDVKKGGSSTAKKANPSFADLGKESASEDAYDREMGQVEDLMSARYDIVRPKKPPRGRKK